MKDHQFKPPQVHTFRAYNVKLDRMLTPAELRQVPLRLDEEGRLICPSELVLMAFTHKWDMNRKPIYEMDILDVDIPTHFESCIRKRGTMIWHEPPGTYTVNIHDSTGIEKGMGIDVLNAVVVGNLVEHPTLIKEEPGELKTHHER